MPAYLHPGVYIEEVPSGVKTIEAVGTSTAAFIGFTTKGPVGQPRLIFNFDDYARLYGGIRDLGAVGDAMGFSVRAFFQNGGTKAYIVRLAANDPPGNPLLPATGRVPPPSQPGNPALLELTAVDPGSWANGLIVRIALKFVGSNLYQLVVGRNDPQGKFQPREVFSDVSLAPASPRFIEAAVNGVSENVMVALRSNADVLAGLTGTSTSGDLTGSDLNLTGLTVADRQLAIRLDGEAPFTIELPASNFTNDLAALTDEIKVLVQNGASSLRRTNFDAASAGNTLVLTSGTRGTGSSVQVQPSGAAVRLELGSANGGTEVSGQARLDALLAQSEAVLAGGADGEPAPLADFNAVFTAFVKIRDVNTICLPDHRWDGGTGQQVLESAIAHAEATRNRMVLIDPPPAVKLETEQQVVGLTLPTSTYTTLYYPWVRVANPFFDEEDNPGVPATLLVPPSGYAAGMWSKIDGRRGVWKAPAGVETQLLGVAGLQFVVEDAEQDQLNPLGVNALRKINGFGHVIWGSRTLSTRANPEWRYVPVRRTAIFIEQSVFNGIQWAVFEPNDHRLWGSLRANLDAFMNGLFRSGAFQGEKASDAYFVRCNLGDTMTQADIDRGQVIVIVGFAPLKPAEFVIVRIQQKVAQQ
jgi:phage tail sheath protein FI